MDTLLLIFGSNDLGVVGLVFGLAVYLGFIAYKRFNDLAPVPELSSYTFTRQTSAWTSTKRFYAAAVAYIALTLGLFRFLLEVPQLVFDLSDRLTEFKDLYEGMQPEFIVPIAAALLIRFAPQYGPVAMIEKGIRSALQRMGAIPDSVLRNHKIFSAANIKVPELLQSTLRDNTDDRFPAELAGTDVALRIEDMLHRTAYLAEAFAGWQEPGSPFQPFWARHPDYLDELRNKTSVLAAQAQPYLKLSPNSRQEMEGTHKDLQEGLSALLRKQHFALACAVFAMRGDLATKEVAFRDLGFQFNSLEEDAPATPPAKIIGPVLNDIALVLLLLFFVAYPAALALLWALGIQPTGNPVWEVMTVWPLMASALILATTLPALLVRRYTWTAPMPPVAGSQAPLDRPYLAYLLATLAAAVILPIMFATIKAVFFPAESGFFELLQKYAVFALLGGSMSLGLSFLLDTPFSRRLLSGTALGAFVACFGAIAYLSSDPTASISGLTLTAVLSFVIGFVNGALIPYAYRRRVLAGLEF